MEFETVHKQIGATCINSDELNKVFDLITLKYQKCFEELESEYSKVFQPDSKPLNPTNSLWLPVSTATITKERIEELNNKIDKILDCSRDSKCISNYIDVQWNTPGDSAIYVCPLLNNKSAIILSTKLLLASRGGNSLEILETIQIGDICKIMTVQNMRTVELVLSTHRNLSSSLILLPEEIEETEMLINYLLIVSCKVSTPKSANRKYTYSWPVFIEVAHCTSILNLPSSVCIKERIVKLGFTDRSVLYAGLVVLSSLENAIGCTHEFMLQKGTEPFMPVLATLTRNTLQLSSIAEGKLEISIRLCELSYLRKVEIPRPYSCCILWSGTTLNLAASTRSEADEWFERICHAKRKSELTEPQVAHIIITDSILHMFSSESSELLVQAPLFNIVVSSTSSLVGSDSESTIAIIEIETLEAEEIVSHENDRWSLQFLSKADASSCLNLILSNQEDF